MTKEELITALEKADKPSFKLDNVIDLMAFDHGWRLERFGTPDITPRYTASIDAALTLVPEGHCWEVRKGYTHQATVWQIDNEYDAGSGRTLPFGEHRFPAIALCLAALRART